jgi:hypothetical protein
VGQHDGESAFGGPYRRQPLKGVEDRRNSLAVTVPRIGARHQSRCDFEGWAARAVASASSSAVRSGAALARRFAFAVGETVFFADDTCAREA